MNALKVSVLVACLNVLSCDLSQPRNTPWLDRLNPGGDTAKGGEFSHSYSGMYVKDVGIWIKGSFNKSEFELYQRGMKFAAKKGTTWIENEPGHVVYTGFWTQVRSDLEVSADESSNTLKRIDEKNIGGKVCRLYEATLNPDTAEKYFAGMSFMGVHSGSGSGTARSGSTLKGSSESFTCALK